MEKSSGLDLLNERLILFYSEVTLGASLVLTVARYQMFDVLGAFIRAYIYSPSLFLGGVIFLNPKSEGEPRLTPD